MHRICINKLTGNQLGIQSGGYDLPLPPDMPESERIARIIEYQEMNINTMIQNAISAGYKAEDVEAKFITDAEAQIWFQRIAEENAKIPKPKSELELRIEALEAQLAKLTAV